MVADGHPVGQPGEGIAGGQPFQVLPSLLVAGDVAGDQDGADAVASAGIADATGLGTEADVVTITVPLAHLDDVRQDAPSEQLRERCLAGRAVVGMQEVQHRLADDLLERVANHPAVGWRYRYVAALDIAVGDQVRAVLHQQTVFRGDAQGIFQGLALFGDIDDEAVVAGRRLLGGVVRQAGEDHSARRAVQATDRDFEIEGGQAVQGARQFQGELGIVVGLHGAQPGAEGDALHHRQQPARELLAGDAQALGIGGPEGREGGFARGAHGASNLLPAQGTGQARRGWCARPANSRRLLRCDRPGSEGRSVIVCLKAVGVTPQSLSLPNGGALLRARSRDESWQNARLCMWLDTRLRQTFTLARNPSTSRARTIGQVNSPGLSVVR